MEIIKQFLQGAGILTILFFCFIIAASIETGRENDARRARAREDENNENPGADDARHERPADTLTDNRT